MIEYLIAAIGSSTYKWSICEEDGRATLVKEIKFLPDDNCYDIVLLDGTTLIVETNQTIVKVRT